MTDEKMKVAMVGVGGYGGARRNLMRETGLFDIVAAYDINPKALEQCEGKDGARPVGSYEELLETPGIEAMIISTGAKFHAEQTLQALDRGLHVFVEKPLCSTMEELHAILDAQQRTGLVVGVGHNDHSEEPLSMQLREMIETEQIGRVASFEKTTCHTGGHLIKPGNWRGDPEKNPGGMLFQCGVHAFHQLMFLFGPIRRVTSMMRYDVLSTTKTADVAHVLVEMSNGIVGVLSAYHVSPYRHTFNIFGTRTNVYINARHFEEGTIVQTQTTAYNKDPEPVVPLKIAEGPTGKTGTGNVRSFYRAVRHGEKCYPSLWDGARAVAAVFAADESARTGRAVNMPEMNEPA